MNYSKFKVFWGSFEIRVITIIVGITLSIAVLFFGIVHNQIKSMKVDEMQNQAQVLSEVISDKIVDDETYYTMNTPTDASTEEYISAQNKLNHIRLVANLRYLYTAKKNAQGEYVYVIDGLNSDDPKYKAPGDLVDRDVVPDLIRSLNGEVVLGDNVMDKDGEAVYVSYWPVTSDTGEVIGAIVMEFDASNQQESYAKIEIQSIVIIVLVIIAASIIALYLLQKVSDPFYKKMAFTDYLTGLNNRAAFELDLKKLDDLRETAPHIGIIIFDLNNLKEVNDIYGHSAGDKYIKTAADLIDTYARKKGVSYRIGGDEFAILFQGSDPKELEELLQQVFIQQDHFPELNKDRELPGIYAIAYGMAEYDPEIEEDLHGTFNRADDAMYECKNGLKGE